MTMQSITTQSDAGRAIARPELVQRASEAANRAAGRASFAEYQSEVAENTKRRQQADLAAFAYFLQSAGVPVGDLYNDPGAWRGIQWGLIKAFQRWQLAQGYAVSTTNFRISTIKVYAAMASQAGAIPEKDLVMIQTVKGKSQKAAKRINAQREITRLSNKKAEAISITRDQAQALKSQPDTPQGRRDAVLMCLLLDHGLRCGEAAGLRVENFDLKEGTMRFERPKVNLEQNHKLTADTLRALQRYLELDNPMRAGPLLLGSIKGGRLSGTMAERSITERVRTLGEAIGLQGLSAHDCRHFAATYLAKRKTINELMDIFGWSSPAMAVRYIERAKLIEVE